jgi:hypothetical protein
MSATPGDDQTRGFPAMSEVVGVPMSEKKPAPSPGSMSKVIGLYQNLLRRNLEHFFPDILLEPAGDRSVIRLPSRRMLRENYLLDEEPDGFGLHLEYFGSSYAIRPGTPIPFSKAERRLIESILTVLDIRFRTLFDPEVAQRADLLQFAVEDLCVAQYLETPDFDRIPFALEALRGAALSTYENRRVSTGVILLGTDHDPAEPRRVNPPGSPRYSAYLSSIKSIHRICDGLHTVFLIDRQGDLAWPVDVTRWADEVQGKASLTAPCPRPFEAHARATLAGEHVALVLTPSQEIKVFADGRMVFAYSDGRWHLLDIPTQFTAWCQAVGKARPADLAERTFRAALNLSEQRRGALFVVLRDPEESLRQLVAPEDLILDEPVADDPEDPDNLSPRVAKRSLHHLVRGQTLAELDATVLEALAGIDGAVVTDRKGRLLSFGAILRVTPEITLMPRAVQGARTTAALAASYHGPVLKVSEDGFLAMFLGGRRLWEI